MLVARRAAQLNELADAIEAARPAAAAYHHRSISTGRMPPARIGDELRARGLEPNFVVNNAGFGLVGDAAETRPRASSSP